VVGCTHQGAEQGTGGGTRLSNASFALSIALMLLTTAQRLMVLVVSKCVDHSATVVGRYLEGTA
jgi:hypothetical protein